MKITIYRNPGSADEGSLTRDYDLTNCSKEELTNALFDHCEQLEVNPIEAAITFAKGEFEKVDANHEYIIKGTSTKMKMNEVAFHVLTCVGRDV